MTVKTENKEQENILIDDISDELIPEQTKPELSVDEEKMAALKAMMSQKEENSVPPKIIVKKKRTLEFGVIGSGQGGSRLAESLHRLGYTALAFNTASIDLEPIKIPEANKYLFEYGLGGAGKDRNVGHQAAETYTEVREAAPLTLL